MSFEPLPGTQTLPDLCLGQKYFLREKHKFGYNTNLCILIQTYKHILVFRDIKLGYTISVNAASLLCRDVILSEYVKGVDIFATQYIESEAL